MVRSPKSGVNFFSLGDFEEQLEMACRRAQPAIHQVSHTIAPALHGPLSQSHPTPAVPEGGMMHASLVVDQPQPALSVCAQPAVHVPTLMNNLQGILYGLHATSNVSVVSKVIH